MYFTIFTDDKQDAFIKKGTSEAEIPKKHAIYFAETAKKAAGNRLPRH